MGVVRVRMGLAIGLLAFEDIIYLEQIHFMRFYSCYQEVRPRFIHSRLLLKGFL
ncbi:hypothetical protein BH10PSE16_BH10PSE16_18760 [soil metagenome]